MNNAPLTLALPKGRLLDNTREYFAKRGIEFDFRDRKLVAYDQERLFKIMLVKNSDLPTYVHHGIAGLGICGDDVIYESGKTFNRLHTFDFGSTSICLAGKAGDKLAQNSNTLSVATKFTRFTRDYYHQKGVRVTITKLNGSVELAPILGLAPYIVDLVETGNTLRANNLDVFEELKKINVYFIANPAYYKIHYKQIQKVMSRLKEDSI